ncbi:hypothetical protein [Streptomyces sp. NPDC056938]|uniref:hypothetical protein n=1 Tax=Streptomyces sp. NPDC056938 TaxID=3345970 RepID=UPI0036339D7F
MTILKGREGHARVVVMTVLDDEFEAAQREFQANFEVNQTSTYSPISSEEAKGVSEYPLYPFIVAQTADRGTDAASELPKYLYELYAPEIFIVVGIAGGVQREKVEIGKGGKRQIDWVGPNPGDVIIAKFVHFYDYAKNIPSGRYLRYFAIDHPCSSLIAQHARAVKRDDKWQRRVACKRPGTSKSAKTSKCWEEEIVVTNELAGNPSSAQQIDMLSKFDNAMAVEMESIGIARAIHSLRKTVHYDPLWMCIRGISDVVYVGTPNLAAEPDNNLQRKKWTLYASSVAASFARSVVERILRDARPGVAGDAGAPPWTFSEGISNERAQA